MQVGLGRWPTGTPQRRATRASTAREKGQSRRDSLHTRGKGKGVSQLLLSLGSKDLTGTMQRKGYLVSWFQRSQSTECQLHSSEPKAGRASRWKARLRRRKADQGQNISPKGSPQ